MDSFLGKSKSTAVKAGSNASAVQEKVLQEHLPKIIDILREKARPAILEIVADAENPLKWHAAPSGTTYARSNN